MPGVGDGLRHHLGLEVEVLELAPAGPRRGRRRRGGSAGRGRRSRRRRPSNLPVFSLAFQPARLLPSKRIRNPASSPAATAPPQPPGGRPPPPPTSGESNHSRHACVVHGQNSRISPQEGHPDHRRHRSARAYGFRWRRTTGVGSAAHRPGSRSASPRRSRAEPPPDPALDRHRRVARRASRSPEWLVVTADHLAVADGRGQRCDRCAWRGVEQVRTTAGVGGGTLQVRTDGDWVDLAPLFQRAGHAVSQGVPGCSSRPGESLAAGLSLRTRRRSTARSTRRAARRAACGSRPATTPARGACRRGRSSAASATCSPPTPAGAILLCLLTFVGVVAELVPPKLQQYMVDDILSAKAGADAADAGSLPDFKTALLVVVLALAFSRVLLSVVGRDQGAARHGDRHRHHRARSARRWCRSCRASRSPTTTATRWAR